MVYLVEIDGLKYYACEICGSLYEDAELAKRCEGFCRENPGSINAELVKHSIGYIDLKGGEQKVFFKIAPVRGCRRTWFKLCKAGVNIYKAC